MGACTTGFRIDAFNGVERDRYSGFVEWTGQLSDNFSLELGGQYNYVRSDSDNAIGMNPLFVQLANNGVPGPLMNAMALNHEVAYQAELGFEWLWNRESF